jgi:hypothetical protein
MSMPTYRNDILRPAVMKCYNAFMCLEKFSADNSFIDNISNLDNFLIEFRSITFVLQKSLGSNKDAIYCKNRDTFLKSNAACKQITEDRDIVNHEHPFNLGKQLRFIVYTPTGSSIILDKSYTIENEKSLSTLLDSIKEKLLSFHEWEVYFSIYYNFINGTKKVEIYPVIKEGIEEIKKFLTTLYNEFNINDKFTKDTLTKIDNFKFDAIPKEMLFIQDYVYYVKTNSYERGMIAHIVIPDKKIPIKQLQSQYNNKKTFLLFLLYHIDAYIHQEKNIMPTFMIIYKDNTFKMKSYSFSLRTTLYRKINDIVNVIRKENVKSVYFVDENYYYNLGRDMTLTDFTRIPYSERIQYSKKTLLSFFMISSNLNKTSYFFDEAKIDDKKYINDVIKKKPKWEIGKSSFLNPIINAFKEQL